MVSRNLGSGDREKASRTAGNAFVMAIILGICTTVIGLTFLNLLLRLFGATEVLIGHSRDYLSIILYGSLFITYSMVANNIVRSEGRAMVAMVTMLIGTAINLVLDPIFIFGLDMGMQGAAYATIIAQFVSALALFLFFITGKSTLELHARHLILKGSIAKEMIAVGIPSFVRQAGSSITMVVINNMLGKYGGDIFISCFGIINRFFMVIFMSIFGIVQGLQPIVGYNYGARQMGRVKEALKLSIITATGVCTLMFFVLLVFPAQMIGIFTNDPELIGIGKSSIRLVILAVPFVGFQIIAASFFQAIGKVKPALLLGMSRQIILLLPLVIIIPVYYGAHGVFLAFPIADYLAIVLTLIWLTKEVKNLET